MTTRRRCGRRGRGPRAATTSPRPAGARRASIHGRTAEGGFVIADTAARGTRRHAAARPFGPDRLGTLRAWPARSPPPAARATCCPRRRAAWSRVEGHGARPQRRLRVRPDRHARSSSGSSSSSAAWASRSDAVEKEMFRVSGAAGGDEERAEWALRPEPTAGIVRAYLEHGMHVRPGPLRLWMLGPCSATTGRRPAATGSSAVGRRGDRRSRPDGRRRADRAGPPLLRGGRAVEDVVAT